MSVNAVSNNSKSYDAATNGVPAVQNQAGTVSSSPTTNTATKGKEEERSAKTNESRMSGDAMRAKLDTEIASQNSLLASSDPKKKLRNSSEAEGRLKEIASSNPEVYRAITDNIPKLNDNKKQALIQVIMDPKATPQSVRVAAESLGSLPETARIESRGGTYKGVSFGGDQPTIGHLKKLKDEGKIGQGEFDVLAAISKNEGQLNAINSYDGEVVSYGLRQTNGGALHGVLKTVKEQNPEKFKEFFEEKGLSLKEEGGKRGLQYTSPVSGKTFNLPDDKTKEIPLEDRLYLAKVFHQAGQDPQVNEILNNAQIRSARGSLNFAMSTPVAGGTVSDFVGTNRGKAYINDSFNHLPQNAQDQFKKAALDVYSKHGLDVSEPKNLKKDQLFDKVAQEIYQKEHPGEPLPSGRMKEYTDKAKRLVEEEYIQRTKDLRMEFFKEKAPQRLGEMNGRYEKIEQYFQRGV